MKQVEIKGIIPPIITPFNEDESINVQELRAQVNRLIAGGVHALFPFGTNGEGYILNGEEKKLVLETVIEETNGRVPIYAGTGCISTKETVAQSKMAMDMGADVLSIITPSFAAASQNELYEHYKAVAEAVDMPIVLYNIPARTGNALAPATVAKLAQIENIVGAKDSSGNCSWRVKSRKRRQRTPPSSLSAPASNTATRTPSSRRPSACWATTSVCAARRSIRCRKRASRPSRKCWPRTPPRACAKREEAAR